MFQKKVMGDFRGKAKIVCVEGGASNAGAGAAGANGRSTLAAPDGGPNTRKTQAKANMFLATDRAERPGESRLGEHCDILRKLMHLEL